MNILLFIVAALFIVCVPIQGYAQFDMLPDANGLPWTPVYSWPIPDNIATHPGWDKTVWCKEKVEKNVCVQSFQVTEQLVERIEVYPARRKVGDVVYTVSYWENISDETVANVPNWSFAWFYPFSRDRASYYTSTSRKADLQPGKKRLRWVMVLHKDWEEEGFAAEVLHGPNVPQGSIRGKCRINPFYAEVHLARLFLDGKKGFRKGCGWDEPLVRHLRKNLWNDYEPNCNGSLVLIRKWYGFQRPKRAYFSEKVRGSQPTWSGNGYVKVKPSKENQKPQGEDIWDFYLGDTAKQDADETLLEGELALHAEICLTRLLLAYLYSENEEELAKNRSAVLTFVNSCPLPQMLAMTHRLFRIDPENMNGQSSFNDWENWYAAEPPELSGSQRERLLELNEEFRKMRENALLAETKEVRP
ncbi:MAG: hypothetical protein IJD43_13615 [Thermoguttaceae bacterium]|nr:hypothetical protein [Thermoguttaceae bacterium]